MSARDARILIVGAGIAGTALAAYLARIGVTTTVVDRAERSSADGYMLGVLPVGGETLRNLGLFDEYLSKSCAMRRYKAFDRNGRLLKTVDLDRVAALPGSYRGIERADLLDLLTSAADAAQFIWNNGLVSIEERHDRVSARFEDGFVADYDLVVGADGMQSTVRHPIFGGQRGSTYRTGWGGWVVWIPA